MLQWGTVFTHDCCSRLVGSMAKVWQLTRQPFFTRRCAQISVWDQMNLSRNGNIYASRNRYKHRSYDSPTYLFGCVGGAMNGLNTIFDSHFLQEGAPRNLSEIAILANPRSLLDVIEWLVGIKECLECCNILLPSYTKPLMWWWSYEWPQHLTWEPFFTRSCAQESVWDQNSG